MDIEYEEQEKTVCSRGEGLGGMIWHIAVRPEHQRKGVGQKLLMTAEKKLKEIGINRMEAWTRDDDWVHQWYKHSGFQEVSSYLHVYAEGSAELKDTLKSEREKFFPMYAFAHYTGDAKEEIKAMFKRVHECSCFEKMLES